MYPAGMYAVEGLSTLRSSNSRFAWGKMTNEVAEDLVVMNK